VNRRKSRAIRKIQILNRKIKTKPLLMTIMILNQKIMKKINFWIYRNQMLILIKKSKIIFLFVIIFYFRDQKIIEQIEKN
jgi:hypothetical protein